MIIDFNRLENMLYSFLSFLTPPYSYAVISYFEIMQPI